MAYTDNFNRPDSGSLGANWTTMSGMGSYEVFSNKAQVSNVTVDSCVVYTAGAFADDQYSQAALTTLAGAGAGTGIGVLVRAITAAQTFFWAVVNTAGSNNVSVKKSIAGASTDLATRTQAWTATDILRLEVSGSGALTTLRVYRNGVQLGADIVDSSGTHIASGSGGLAYSGNVGANVDEDDWEGGDLAPPGAQNQLAWIVA